MLDLNTAAAFTVFDAQDSGCTAYGVEALGRRWFVKKATTERARASLVRAAGLHLAVRHHAIVRPELILDGDDGLTLVYPWCPGTVLNHATAHGSDRSGLVRFQSLPLTAVRAALDVVLDAHLAVAEAGYIPVDLYDGCFLYDFDAGSIHLIDLDEYRPGPFVLDAERLPGSRPYMPPESLRRGALIDHRSGVYSLGRVLYHLLDAKSGWRGSAGQRAVVDRATRTAPENRYPDIPALVQAWRRA